MKSYKVNIVLDQLICKDEGDGPGNAEPYIWAAFFKIDDDTVAINQYRIEGKRTIEKPVQVHFSLGSHNNLSSQAINIEDDGVDAGDIVPIPAVVGSWTTTLKPSLVPDPANNNRFVDLPGVAGVLYFLLEEDNVTDFASSQGHLAFNNFFEEKINYFFHSFDLFGSFAEIKSKKLPGQNVEPKDLYDIMKRKSEELVKELREEGSKLVERTIQYNTLPVFWPAILINPDDNLGDDMQLVSNITLDEMNGTTIHFEKSFGGSAPELSGGGFSPASDGSFTITGHISATELPVSLPPFTTTDPSVKGAMIYKDVNFEGEQRFLIPGRYSLGERTVHGFIISASTFDNAIDSVKVDSGYYIQLFKAPDFSGEMLEITHDTPMAWLDDNWRDQVSSIIVGSLTERIG